MAKRDFRTSRRESGSPEPARYPTLDDFDTDRRRFLGGLGALFGAGVLGSALAACGSERRISTHSDAGVDARGPEPVGPEVGGGAPLPPAPADAGVPDPDIEQYPPQGEAPMPDARIDHDGGGPKPDVEFPLSGDAPAPDAGIDQAPDWGMAGGISEPDAGIDEPDMMPSPGFAPQPDAAIDDSGSCPNP